MRRILISSSVVVVAVIVVAIVILSSSVDRFRPRVQSELQKKLNRPVALGHLELRLLPLSIRIDSFSIGEDPTFLTGKPFAQAQEVFVSVGVFSLITGNPQVKSLILTKPQIELVKNAKGLWNFSTLGSNNQNSSNSGQFSLDDLQIKDGDVALTDQFAGEPRVVYDGINLNLDGYGPGKRFGVELGLSLPGQGRQEFSFKGKVGPVQADKLAVTPVTGHIKAKDVAIASMNRLSPELLPPNTDGILSADADVSTQNEEASVKGDMKLEFTVAWQ